MNALMIEKNEQIAEDLFERIKRLSLTNDTAIVHLGLITKNIFPGFYFSKEKWSAKIIVVMTAKFIIIWRLRPNSVT